MPNYAVAIRPYASVHAAPSPGMMIPDPLSLASAWLASETAVRNVLVSHSDQIVPEVDAKSAMMSAMRELRAALKDGTSFRLPGPQTSVYVPIKNDAGATIGHSVISSVLDSDEAELEASVPYPEPTDPAFTCAIYLNATAVALP